LKPMKVGLDIHGVIDEHPEVFKELSQRWTDMGHEVHILTGDEWSKVRATVDDLGIIYHAHFSILDYWRAKDEPSLHLEDTGWWMDRLLWNRSKGDYASRVGLDIHFDNDKAYIPYFVSCSAVLVPSIQFSRIMGLLGYDL
jgi:hypothetical protein